MKVINLREDLELLSILYLVAHLKKIKVKLRLIFQKFPDKTLTLVDLKLTHSMSQVLSASMRNRYKPDKMMTELRQKLEMRDLGQEEVDTSVRSSSLSRGLDGRIVMEIKNDQEQRDPRPRKRRSLVDSVIGSLGRKKKGEKKEFSDSASRYVSTIS